MKSLHFSHKKFKGERCFAPTYHTNIQSGFTLLELITVIAMISILITVAYPTYTHHMIKTKRTHAQIALLNMAAGMERHYVLLHSYENATLSNLQMNAYTENNDYQLEIKNATQDNYFLEAVPQNTQRRDTDCGTLSLDKIGRKGISGTGNVHACW